MDHGDKKQRLSKLSRAYGATAEAKAAIKRAYESYDDWRGKCPNCGERLEGTLDQLREHKCNGS